MIPAAASIPSMPNGVKSDRLSLSQPVTPTAMTKASPGCPALTRDMVNATAFPHRSAAARLVRLRVSGTSSTVNVPSGKSLSVTSRSTCPVIGGGPVDVIGWSLGGTLGQAVAAELRGQGHEVGLLALLDSVTSDYFARNKAADEDYIRAFLAERVGHMTGDGDGAFLDVAARLLVEHLEMMQTYESPVFDGDVVFFNATRNQESGYAEQWRPLIGGTVHEHDIDCAHQDMYHPGPAQEISKIVRAALGDDAVSSEDPGSTAG